MTSTLTLPTAPPAPVGPRTPALPRYGATTLVSPRRRRQRRHRLLGLGVVLLLLLGAGAVEGYRWYTDDSRREFLAADGWPSHGQAALAVGDAPLSAGPNQRPAPIASMAKVMTAYLVLRSHPLRAGRDGFTLRITARDAERTARQRSEDQSVVSVAAGETLTERQALLALLLPSANNVAEFLARRVAGSVPAFVARMNATARALRMTSTRYTDPSGFDRRTVSTAVDQVVLARVVARVPAFAALVATRSARLPVAGTVHNTDTLLGQEGIVGTKTGSMDASGGCFMFRAIRVVDGRPTEVLGVVMGQSGHNLINAGLYAARQLLRNRAGTA